MSAPASRPPRPARRALDELSLRIDRDDLDARLAGFGPGDGATRSAALDAYEALPAESNRLYTTYLDLRAADLAAAEIQWAPATRPVPVALPPGTAGLLEFTDGDVSGSVLSPEATAAGVQLTTIADYLERRPSRAAELLDGSDLPADDKFAQLTRALWTQGTVIDIPAGVHLEQPIVVRWAAGAPDRALLTRTLIALGDQAQASVVEELVSSGADVPGRQSLLTGTTEVILGVGAKLAMAGLQDLGPDVIALQHRVARIGEGADLHWALAQLGGRLVRSRIDNRLVGDRSSVEQVEIVFGGDEQLFDLTSYTTHIGRDTTGNLLSKGALLDRARTYMKGLITIDKTAIGTDSFLGEFGMNLSKAARSVAIPSLEIDQPDCRRAMHSSSVGPIDEAQLFYLESRGIPPDQARKFIVLGFLEPVVARVPLEAAQDRLRERLEAKWTTGTRATETAADATTTSVATVVRRIDLVAVADVPEGTMHMAFVDGTDQVLVVNTNGEFHALQGVCSHEYFELDKGFLTSGTLTCALHLSRFDLENGEPLDPPAEEPLAVYAVVIEDGRVLIEVPDGPLEISE